MWGAPWRIPAFTQKRSSAKFVIQSSCGLLGGRAVGPFILPDCGRSGPDTAAWQPCLLAPAHYQPVSRSDLATVGTPKEPDWEPRGVGALAFYSSGSAGFFLA
ncbi:unnamed protein product [Pleuronectes platessa]|uniref:Uncharacterized protein n=1 Tax=Pleuronectes platessa TaxID=8262 RepID=A0A9N7YR50_PLEPL|nr:unnamed protein product [Pleuronectes platessa]